MPTIMNAKRQTEIYHRKRSQLFPTTEANPSLDIKSSIRAVSDSDVQRTLELDRRRVAPTHE